MHHLDEATVASLLDPAEMVDIIERALTDLGRGEADSTLRVRAKAGGAMASAMAAVIPALGVSGGKIYSTTGNKFTFHVVLFDLAGDVLCTLDGAALTEVRTPALSAVAIRRMAPTKVETVALLGTGREALPHLEMLHRELAPSQLRIWGRSPDRAESIASAGRRFGASAETFADADSAVEDADVVVTVTSSDQPLFDPAALSARALVCAIGATKAERCEIPPEAVAAAAAVVADSSEGSRTECGDLIRAEQAGMFSWDQLIDFPDVLTGRVPVARSDESGPVIFESQGLAILDVAAAAQAWSHHCGRLDPKEK